MNPHEQKGLLIGMNVSKAFKEVFANRKMIRSLLQDIICEAWVDLINLDSMRIESGSFCEIDAPERMTDELISFDLKNNQKLSLYILMEFQSSNNSMIFRLLEYLSRIYKAQKKKAVHPIIPIVIYNGESKWREDQQFISHLSFIKGVECYIPDFKYILVDIGRIPDKVLKELKTAAAYFFRLDKTDFKKRDNVIDSILSLLNEIKLKDHEIFSLMNRYIRGLMNYKNIEISEINDYIDYEGAKSMLAQSLEKLINESRLEGEFEGKHEKESQIALNLLKEGRDIDFVSRITGLSKEEISQLRNNS